MSTAALTQSGSLGPLPNVGQSIWIEDLPAGPVEVCVEQVQSPALRTDAPRIGGRELPVRRGASVKLFYHAAEVPTSATATVVPTPAGQPDGLWFLIRRVERTQRRGAVRVPALVVARLRCDDPEVDVVGATEDISSTGVLMRTAEKVPEGATMRLDIHFGGSTGDLRTAARVVRVHRADSSARPWKVALTYVDMPPSVEDRVVRFVFERQREIQSRAAGLT